MSGEILAIDQGTTSSRGIVFDDEFAPLGSNQQEFTQHFPHSGWVEHDAEDLWDTTVATARGALEAAGLGAADIAGIGITNQRETVVVWDRETGKPVHRAIVWQDRRTAEMCQRLKAEGHEVMVTERTGLLLDPYFSASKLGWLLDNVNGARAAATDGRLAFGTVDSFLIWRLTGGRVHATDATNASRTMLYDIGQGDWDDDLLSLFGVPRAMLPEVRDCADDFGVTEPDILGAAVPILGVAGDQQAATLGQACFQPGMLKSTYGTGCFALLNTGETRVQSTNRLLTTIAYRIDGVTTFALEGSIFVAGSAIQWLRDGLGLLDDAAQSGPMAARSEAEAGEDAGPYLVPAFVGLGAPWWDPDARGAMFGLTRGTNRDDFVRAALESVCYQTHDLLEAMRGDWNQASVGTGTESTVLRVDGGMVASDWTMQRLADILDAPVDRPSVLETTALGAAWLAGQKAGVWPDKTGFASAWRLDKRFESAMDPGTRKRKIAGWADAVGRTLTTR